jgi:hypothetical protein
VSLKESLDAIGTTSQTNKTKSSTSNASKCRRAILSHEKQH